MVKIQKFLLMDASIHSLICSSVLPCIHTSIILQKINIECLPHAGVFKGNMVVYLFSKDEVLTGERQVLNKDMFLIQLCFIYNIKIMKLQL